MSKNLKGSHLKVITVLSNTWVILIGVKGRWNKTVFIRKLIFAWCSISVSHWLENYIKTCYTSKLSCSFQFVIIDSISQIVGKIMICLPSDWFCKRKKPKVCMTKRNYNKLNGCRKSSWIADRLFLSSVEITLERFFDWIEVIVPWCSMVLFAGSEKKHDHPFSERLILDCVNRIAG